MPLAFVAGRSGFCVDALPSFLVAFACSFSAVLAMVGDWNEEVAAQDKN